MTKLILIRHGETNWNVEGRYTGQTDIPLNSHGIKQAHILTKRLSSQNIDAIYSSDLRRALQTAEILAEACGAPLFADARLREINQGQWEGMHFEEIRARFAKAWRRRKDNPLEVAPPGGETVRQVRARVLHVVEEILQRHPNHVVAIVSHGLALSILKTHFGGFPIEKVWDHIPSNTEPETIHLEAK
jgi:alpha-ribazole phosphatase